jgi:hypothetical protein
MRRGSYPFNADANSSTPRGGGGGGDDLFLFFVVVIVRSLPSFFRKWLDGGDDDSQMGEVPAKFKRQNNAPAIFLELL